MEVLRPLFLLFWLTQCVNSYKLREVGQIKSLPDVQFTTENTAVATTVQPSRNPRWYRRGGHEGGMDEYEDHGDMDHDDQGETKAISHGKIDYWAGYYDFLINEGSYKFWAVFQLATAALLIYSGFAALYYAKVNPTTNDDYDYFLRKRRRRRDAFLGLDPETFQRILDAVSNEW